MKDNKGFTLVELLAVIVILAIVLAIAIPGISQIMTTSKASLYKAQMDLIKRAANIYISEYGDKDTTTVTLDQLVEKELISQNSLNPIDNQVLSNLVIDTSGVTNSEDYSIYKEPELVTGMIPVYFDEIDFNWKKADSSNTNNDWYNYSDYKWANAVTVTSTNRSTYLSAAVGTIIPMSDINTMWVWIPRYKYMIPSGSGAREIKVVLESNYAPKSVGNAVSTYYTHPAFTFGNTELNGIWVAKFEATGTATAPTIRPNENSIQYQSIKSMFNNVKTYMQESSTYGFTNDSDVHLAKNIDWSAAAYLSQSRYGKYKNPAYDSAHKEVYRNNSENAYSGLYTGRSAGDPAGSIILTPTYDYTNNGYYTYDGKCATINSALPSPCNEGSEGQVLIDKTLSYGASTTGTIYGIYDMAGGKGEYVMAVYMPNPIPTTGISDRSGYSTVTTNSQYDLLTIDSKYYDRYLSTASMLGDALKETSGWYSDVRNYLSASYPWYYRGKMNSTFNGAFAFCFGTGESSNDRGFRLVLTPNN